VPAFPPDGSSVEPLPAGYLAESDGYSAAAQPADDLSPELARGDSAASAGDLPPDSLPADYSSLVSLADSAASPQDDSPLPVVQADLPVEWLAPGRVVPVAEHSSRADCRDGRLLESPAFLEAPASPSDAEPTHPLAARFALPVSPTVVPDALPTPAAVLQTAPAEAEVSSSQLPGDS
jgi:hypothetical protein